MGKDLGMAEEEEVSFPRAMCFSKAKLYFLIGDKNVEKTV